MAISKFEENIRGLPPNYGSYDAQACEKKEDLTKLNTLRHLASDVENESIQTPIALNQDIDVFGAELEEGKSISIEIPEGRQAYLLCVEGSLGLDSGKTLKRHDTAELFGNTKLKVTAKEAEETENGKLAHLLLFCHGGGSRIRPPRSCVVQQIV